METKGNSGRTKIVRYSSSLSQLECEKIRFYASKFAPCGPALEIGSFVGSSTIFIGVEYKQHGNVVYSIDHHRGSTEQQPGCKNFEKDLYNESIGKIDSFTLFREQIEKFGLEKTIIPIVCDSNIVAKYWNIPLSLLFIDGGHEVEQSINDVNNYAPFVVEGGVLAIHDVDVYGKHEDSYEGPRAAFFQAISMGFTPVDFKNALVFLRKGSPELYGVPKEYIKEITNGRGT
jgi:hypothetical protein